MIILYLNLTIIPNEFCYETFLGDFQDYFCLVVSLCTFLRRTFFFADLLNMVSATETAELIVKNLRKRSSILWIPSRYYYLHNFARLLPNTVQHLIMDFIDTGIDIHYDNTDNL